VINTVSKKCSGEDFIAFLKLAMSKPILYRLVKSGKISLGFLAENISNLREIEDEMKHIQQRETCARKLKEFLRRGLAEELGYALHGAWLSQNPDLQFENFADAFRDFLVEREDYRTALVKGSINIDHFASFKVDELGNLPPINKTQRKKRRNQIEESEENYKVREIFRGKLLSKVNDVKVKLFQISGKPIKRLYFTRNETAVYALKIQGRLRILKMRDYLKQVIKSQSRSINIVEVRCSTDYEARYDRLEK
jgi:hypothetical protein